MVLGRHMKAEEASRDHFPFLGDFFYSLPPWIQDENMWATLIRVHALMLLLCLCLTDGLAPFLHAALLRLTLQCPMWKESIAHLLWALLTWVDNHQCWHTVNMYF